MLAIVADTVSQASARQKAADFLAAKSNVMTQGARSYDGAAVAQPLTLAPDSRHDGLYIYNVGQSDGFVIVSASDRTDDIVGYSDTGHFDSAYMPDALRALLDDYNHQITFLEQAGQDMNDAQAAFLSESAARRAAKSSVPALLTTRWNQEAPYNSLCPTFDGVHAATGCVATAMAQLMYYHKYPSTSPAISGYKSSTSSFGDIIMPDLPATTFDWSNMHNSYASSDDAAEVSKLMRYCGQSVQMNYGRKASSASSATAVDRLVDCFGYDGGLRTIKRSDYYYSEWSQLIYDELAARRPVLIGGQSAGGGHAFICDGYDAESDMYHINWGWGGLSDAFFRLSLLNPQTQGIGGSITTDGFNLSLSASIGIKPGTGQTPVTDNALTVLSFKLGDTEGNTFSRSDTSSDFIVIPTLSIMNLTGSTHSYKYGVRLRQGNNIVMTDIWSHDGWVTFDKGNGRTVRHHFSFGSQLSNGTYRMEVIYQADGDTEWQLCKDGDENYLELTIADTELTVNAVDKNAYKLEVLSVGYDHEQVTQGVPEVVTIVVRNSGASPYHGDITFLTVKDGSKESWGGMAVDIDPNSSATVKVEHTPARFGTFAAYVFQGLFEQGVMLAEDSITIAEAEAEVSQADLAFDINISNALGNKILGNTANVKITVTNNSDAIYRGVIDLFVYSWSGQSANGTCNPIHIETIPAQTTVELERNIEDLQTGATYSFTVGYQSNNQFMQDQTDVYKRYQTVVGYATYDATGTATIIEAADSAIVADGVVCVDLRHQNMVKVVVANDNPNVLYLLDSGAVTPAGISGNVVKGTTAESIRLTDGFDFYNPIAFTAKHIEYTRTFATGTNGSGGWASLMLPFSATSVSVSDSTGASSKAIDWYHSETDTNKDFWLMAFTNDSGGKLTFTHLAANATDAYTPYLVAVPGNRWGEGKNLVGKPIKFCAQNATVDKDLRVDCEGDLFRFIGTLRYLDRADFWRLNAEGNQFAHSEGTIMPFRAVFTLKDGSTTAADTIDAPLLSKAMAITTVATSHTTSGPVFRLDGTRVNVEDATRLPRGLYITRGKKMVVRR